MVKNRIILLLLPFLVSCAITEALLNPTDPNDVLAIPESAMEKIIENPYTFNWPDLLVCPKTINAYICVTANSKDDFVVSLSDWKNNGWDQEMVNVDRGGLSDLIAEVRTLCQQNFKPELQCKKLMEKSEFIDKLLNKEE